MTEIEELTRCRLCFSPNNLTDAVFPATGDPNEELMGMIYACTSVRISFERDFPCAVCSSCVRIVNQFYAFRRKCRSNDRELKRTRGEKGFDEGSEEEEEDDGGNDPLGARRIKWEAGGDDRFYGKMKQQIQSYLKKQVAELEKKALAMVREGIQNTSGGNVTGVQASALQMTVEDAFGGNDMMEQNDSTGYDAFQDYDGDDEPLDDDKPKDDSKNSLQTEGTDWKTKYETLQKNNDLLQKAFRDQRSKLKDTEQLLKTVKRQKSSGNFTDTSNAPEGVGFKTHPAIPEVSLQFLQDLNYKSGPGEKGDRSFISKLAVAAFGVDTLVNSSVTGRPSNAHRDLPPKPSLCPQKMAAIGLKLFERVQLEVGVANQEELLARTTDRLVRLTVCQKSMNLRKQFFKHNGSSSADGTGAGNGSMDEEYLEEQVPATKKRRR
uniref:BEN domain-containing protein 5 n=1 Tax=Culex pipiens TaxID=7175 RepID=A0A8D8MT21_CULPI